MDRQRTEVKEETPTEDIDANFFTFQRQAVHQAQGFATKDVIQGLNGFAPEDCQDFDSGRSSLHERRMQCRLYEAGATERGGSSDRRELNVPRKTSCAVVPESMWTRMQSTPSEIGRLHRRSLPVSQLGRPASTHCQSVVKWELSAAVISAHMPTHGGRLLKVHAAGTQCRATRRAESRGVPRPG